MDIACVCVKLYVSTGVIERQERRRYQRVLERFHGIKFITVKWSKESRLIFLKTLI